MESLDCNSSDYLSIRKMVSFYYSMSERCNVKRPLHIFFIILCCLYSGGSFAGSRFVAGLISPDNVNLNVHDFLRFYAINNSQEKENTLMYALGVQEVTEGKTWCRYEHVDSATINQTILATLEKQSTVKADIRASTMIEVALVKNYPCQEKKLPANIISRTSPDLSLTPETYNLSGNDFFRLWVSGNEQNKLRAGIYLLGIEDATENKLWCGYDFFKSLTLNEIIYSFLKNKTREELNVRAADVIVGKLMEYPCDAGTGK